MWGRQVRTFQVSKLACPNISSSQLLKRLSMGYILMVKLALVIGQGEVGNPLYEMLADAFGPDEVFCRDIKEPDWHHHFKYLHICYPQTVSWGASIINYLRMYKPEAVIIHSTLHPGSIEQLNQDLEQIFYYSPVRGNIRDGMRWCLENYCKYIAGPDEMLKFEPAEILSQRTEGLLIRKKVSKHLEDAGFTLKWVYSPTSLEYAKILDLCWYGLNIAFYQELERICDSKSLEYGPIKDFIESTPRESGGKAERVLFYGGFIGGHCVIPAFEKLLAAHDVPMIRAALESNIKRELESLQGRVPGRGRVTLN